MSGTDTADMAALPRELDRAPWHVVDAKSTLDAPLHRIMIKAAFVGGGEHKSLDVIVFECGGGSTSVRTVPPRLWRGGVNAGDFMSEVTPPSHKLKQRSHSHHIACTTSCSMTCTRAPACAHHPLFALSDIRRIVARTPFVMRVHTSRTPRRSHPLALAPRAGASLTSTTRLWLWTTTRMPLPS